MFYDDEVAEQKIETLGGLNYVEMAADEIVHISLDAIGRPNKIKTNFKVEIAGHTHLC